MKRTFLGDILWPTTLLLITAFLVIPTTQQVFIQLTSNYPYGISFLKFAILATMGELLALRLASRKWMAPLGMAYKVAVWGVIGMLIHFMFAFYAGGVATLMAQGPLAGWEGPAATFLRAFLTSAIMNLTFGIVFMAMHRMSDTYIELRVTGEKPSLKELIELINWDAFISFVVFKTILLFWIPAHTITFSLPENFRVAVAAYLSIVLGVILVYSYKMKQPNPG